MFSELGPKTRKRGGLSFEQILRPAATCRERRHGALCHSMKSTNQTGITTLQNTACRGRRRCLLRTRRATAAAALVWFSTMPTTATCLDDLREWVRFLRQSRSAAAMVGLGALRPETGQWVPGAVEAGESVRGHPVAGARAVEPSHARHVATGAIPALICAADAAVKQRSQTSA